MSLLIKYKKYNNFDCFVFYMASQRTLVNKYTPLPTFYTAVLDSDQQSGVEKLTGSVHHNELNDLT